MDCNRNFLTVKEWFETLGRDMNINCERQVRIMNDVLMLLWIDTYELKNNVNFVTFNASGIQTFNTPYPIYDIDGFYVINSDCNTGCGFVYDTNTTCYNSCCGTNKFREIQMHDVIETTCLLPCQYQRCRDGKKIEAHIPSGITNGFVRYYRGFEILTNINDEIPVQPSLLPAIRMLVKMAYAELGQNFTGDDLKYESRYNEFIRKIKDRDALRLKFISMQGER